MIEVAILTPDPSEASYDSLWPKVLSRLQRALDEVGIHTVPTPWTAHDADPVGLGQYARVLPLLAWGYHFDHARWLRACRVWQQAGVSLANPAQVLAWNSDKRYLGWLAERGIPIPPTTWSEDITREQVEAMFDATGAGELIIKPSVSGGAWKTQRIGRGDAVDAQPGDMTMMLQPYLPSKDPRKGAGFAQALRQALDAG